MLTSQFKINKLGKLCHFLGIDFNKTQGLIHMSQEKYSTKILYRFDMSDFKPRMKPCKQKLDFTKSNTDGLTDPRKYRKVIGSLIH